MAKIMLNGHEYAEGITARDAALINKVGAETLQTTAQTCSGAINELKSNLTDLPNNLTFGTPVQIPWTNNKYTCPSAGVVTGYVRKTENTTAGYVSIRSSVSNIYRVFSTLSGISGMYLNINFNVVKNEELTIAGSEILNRALYFIPYEIN